MEGHRSVVRVAAALALLLGLGSCLGREPTESSPLVETTLLVRANLSGTAVASMVVEVTAPDLPTPVAFNLPIINSVASGTIKLRAGSDRTITMQAYDAGGVETHRGSVTIDVHAGTNVTISLVLMPLTGDVPIDVTVGSFTVTVTPAATTVTVGDTFALTASILDATGKPVTGQAVWATLAPAIATVVSTGQQTGRVTAVGPGQTAVAATYGGVAGETRIVVSSDPKLPTLLNTQSIASAGSTIDVPAGGDFQAALNAAQPGDQIVLAAGATYAGNFTLRAKSGAGWIIIRTSSADAALPAEGQRMKPSYAPLLPRIVSPNGDAAIRTEPRAAYYRLVGLEVTMADDVTDHNGLVLFGDGSPAQNTLTNVPHDLILDRSYVHGNATGNLSRCLALNSAASAVIDSYLSACHANGQDAQAIGGWNGPGPFKIVNNYLEASGENVMFGGADPSIPNLIPSDIEIRRNYFFKPLAWRASGAWTVKNLLELKLGRRVLIQGNIFENSWAAAQAGFAIVIWSVNQEGGAPWAVTEDIWFRENIVRHAASGLQLTDRSDLPSLTTQRVRFDNNLWEDINGATWGGDGRLFQLASNTHTLHAIKFYHQTGFVDETLITIASGTTQQFEFGDNVVAHGTFGIKSDDAGDGLATLNLHLPGWRFAGNVVIGAPSASYPPGNFYPAALSDVGFVDAIGGDYRLAASSPYKGQATDGADPGANMAAVLFWTNGVDQ